MFNRCKIALALAASLGAATPALATPVGAPTTPPARALLLIPLTITKVQDIHFGTIVPSTTTAGVVTINAVTGARTATGGITLVTTDDGQRAQFAGAGSAGQKVFIDITPPTDLVNPAGDKIPVIALTLDGPALRTIGTNQSFFVNVGGSIFVDIDKPEGLYSAMYNITAEYM